MGRKIAWNAAPRSASVRPAGKGTFTVYPAPARSPISWAAPVPG